MVNRRFAQRSGYRYQLYRLNGPAFAQATAWQAAIIAVHTIYTLKRTAVFAEMRR